MLDAAGVPRSRRALQRSADCRYRRQAYEPGSPQREFPCSYTAANILFVGASQNDD